MLRCTADEQLKKLTMPKLKAIEDVLQNYGELSKRDIGRQLGLGASVITHYIRKHPERFEYVRTEKRNGQPTKIFCLSEKYIQETPFEVRIKKFEAQGLTTFAPGFKSLTERFQ